MSSQTGLHAAGLRTRVNTVGSRHDEFGLNKIAAEAMP